MKKNSEKTMDLRKQLFAAIAMLIVAAVALASSTYAWFVNNNSVKGEGMQINATSDASLLIRGVTGKTTSEAFSGVGTVAGGDGAALSAELKPCTSYDGLTFGKLVDTNVTVDSPGSYAATWKTEGFGTGGASSTDGTDLSKLTDTTGYVLYAKYEIAAAGKGDGNETAQFYLDTCEVSAVTSGQTSNMTDALYMSITSNNYDSDKKKAESVTKVYSLGNATEADLVGKLDSTTGWKLVSPSITSKGSSGYAWKLLTQKGEITSGQTIEVRVWYEGQDSDCFSNNLDTNQVKLTLNFKKVV